MTTATQRILTYVQGSILPVTAPDVARDLKIPIGTATSRMTTLRQRGLLACAGKRTPFNFTHKRTSMSYIAHASAPMPAAAQSNVRTPPAAAVSTRTHIVLVLDCSGSMEANRNGAARLYNQQLDAIRKFPDSAVTVFRFGLSTDRSLSIREQMFNRPIDTVQNIRPEDYPCAGMTPLVDAVIEATQRAACDQTPDTSYLVVVLTDGLENQSRRTSGELSQLMAEKTASDRWTFAFLCPKGNKGFVTRNCGAFDGNVREWDDIDKAAKDIEHGTQSFLQDRKTKGTRSTKTYFKADLSSVDVSKLTEMTSFRLWTVAKEASILDFVQSKIKTAPYVPGKAYYELMKKEKQIQDYKRILLLDTATGRIYVDGSITVRAACGYPESGDIAVEPGNHGGYTILVQSTSTNRILPRGTRLAYFGQR